MKHIFVTIVTIIILAVISLNSTLYLTNATVIDVADDLVTVEDDNGNVWAFYGTDYQINDSLKCVFDGKNTTTIYDDEIVNIF